MIIAIRGVKIQTRFYYLCNIILFYCYFWSTLIIFGLFTARVAPFSIPQIPAPPTPPEVILNEQDRQAHLQYEHWLNNQHQVLTQQLKYYETEVQKLRKMRKVVRIKSAQNKIPANELNII